MPTIGTKSLRITCMASLGVTLALWGLAWLFKLHLFGVFQYVLMKRFPGPTVTYGLMALSPVVAAISGVLLFRRPGMRRVGAVYAASGAFLVIVFMVIIGRVMYAKAYQGPPPNPQTPRIVEPLTGLPVFPGAEGFGSHTRAGRGGKVIEVTTLADDGPGSLRAAVNDPSPRTIVFRVGGTIALKDFLFISHPFITIAGQTSPGGGICLKNAGIVITTNDVLIQHLRIRPGREGTVRPEDNDAITLLGKNSEVSGADHVVIDHVSASWSEDEVVSVWAGAHDVTFSHCIISEGLNRSRHEKDTHSAGLLIGDGSYHVTVHHSLLAHNDFRNPLISKGGTHDIVNNVIYDWGALPAEIFDLRANSFVNFIGNYFRAGPSTVPNRYEILVNPTREPGSHQPKLFVLGNIGPHRKDITSDDWSLVGFGFSDRNPAPLTMQASAQFPTHRVTPMSAAEALISVLSGSGATLPARDLADRRVVEHVTRGTGRIIDSPDEAGGYPVLAGGVPTADSDHDGMPDAWERAHRLDPADPSDASKDRNGDGYTNLEEYLNSLCKEPGGQVGKR